jgi:hypothetical protein
MLPAKAERDRTDPNRKAAKMYRKVLMVFS